MQRAGGGRLQQDLVAIARGGQGLLRVARLPLGGVGQPAAVAGGERVAG